MKIEKSKNIIANSIINTKGGNVSLGDHFYKSIEYKTLETNIARLKRLIQLAESEVERKGYEDDLSKEQSRLKSFMQEVVALAERFQKITIDEERIKKVKAYFDFGEFGKAFLVLEQSNIEQEQIVLLERKEKANKLLEESQNALKVNAEAFLVLAKLTSINYSLSNRYEKTIRAYEKSILADKNLDNLFDYAFFLLVNHDFKQSKSLFEQVIELVDDQYHDDEIAQKCKAASLANISNILRRTELYEDSLNKRREALELQNKVYDKDDEEILLSKYNLALIHSKLKNSEKALNYLMEVSNEFDNRLSRDTLNKEFNKGHLFNASGIIYAETDRLQEATKWFVKAFEYRKTLKTDDEALDFGLVSESAHNTAKAFFHLQQYDKAEQFALIAREELRKAISIDAIRFINDERRNENLLTKLKEL